jgi:hypothetical protein
MVNFPEIILDDPKLGLSKKITLDGFSLNDLRTIDDVPYFKGERYSGTNLQSVFPFMVDMFDLVLYGTLQRRVAGEVLVSRFYSSILS